MSQCSFACNTNQLQQHQLSLPQHQMGTNPNQIMISSNPSPTLPSTIQLTPNNTVSSFNILSSITGMGAAKTGAVNSWQPTLSLNR